MSELESLMEVIDQRQSLCTHCGLCLDSCSTYLQSNWEMESPRGRIRLSKEFIEGRLDPKSPVLESFDHCLACRRCEEACPVGVPYSELLEEVQTLRQSIHPKRRASKSSWLQKVQSPRRRHWYRRSLGKEIQGVPALGSYVHKRGVKRPSKRVLFVPCAADLCDHALIDQALDLARELACPLEVNQRQSCCQNSECEEGEYFFLTEDCQPKGACPSLAELLAPSLRKRSLQLAPQTLYYHPSCYAKGDPYLSLLQGIQGIRLEAVPFSQSCCGARGTGGQVEDLIQWRCQLLPSDASLLTSSSRCMMAYRRYSSLAVYHPLQILHRALFQPSDSNF